MNSPAIAEMEARLLAAIMVVEGSLDTVAERLRPEHFSQPLFGFMFAEMLRLAANGDRVDLVTICRAAGREPAFESLGGTAFWARLTGDSLIPMALAHVDAIINAAKARQIKAALRRASEAIDADTDDAPAALAALNDLLAGAVTDAPSMRFVGLGQAYRDALERVEAVRNGEASPGLLAHGWSDWNDLTGGMHPGQYILLAGLPSMGKTAVSLALARRTAQAGHGVLYISREMTLQLVMERMLADLMMEFGGQATFDDIKRGRVSNSDLRLMHEARAMIDGWPLLFIAPESLGALQIGPLIRRARQDLRKRGADLGLVIVDYFGLIDPPEGKPNREQEAAAISRALKNAAQANQVPIVVLSQLSRSVAGREDKRPVLSDLRDSGALEADADVVVFVYRDEYYLRDREPDRASPKWEEWHQGMAAARDRIEIYTSKNRQGDVMKRRGYFFGARQAIRNHDFFEQGGF